MNPLALTAILTTLLACSTSTSAQEQRPGREPPPQAYEDCRGHQPGDLVQHATREGPVAANCVDTAKGLVARPKLRPNIHTNNRLDAAGQGGPGAAPPQGQGYSLDQAVSDRAQLNTIAFDALAFITGDFGYDTFLPPGKVSDYFGFQYMRDIDTRGGGHNTSFLTLIAHNVLGILDAGQRAQLVALARQQAPEIRRFAEMRLPLIKAFRLNLDGSLPPGTGELDGAAIVRHSAELYAQDGKLAFERARGMAAVLRSLNASQKAALARLRFGDSGTWPEVAESIDRRSLPHDVHVAVMTYASEMFSWYAGSLDADTYFCPERHGMYFGGFGMKTAPAMGKRNQGISTSLTGDAGEAFLAVLTPDQRGIITALPDQQRTDLADIIRLRRQIATELRRFMAGDTADHDKVIALSRAYGERDGHLSYDYAVAFARVAKRLNPAQRALLRALREHEPDGPRGPFLYSSPIRLPAVEGVETFFTKTSQAH